MPMEKGLFNRSRGFGMNAQLPVRPEPRAGQTNVNAPVMRPKSLGDVTEADLLQLPDNKLMEFFVKNNLLSQMYATATNIGRTRQEKYRDYEVMMDNVLMASYLDLLVDDALQFDSDRQATVWVDESTPYEEDIQDFLDNVLDVETTGPGILFLLLQYGDFFVMPEFQPGVGVTSCRLDVFPGTVWRIDLNGKLFAFAYQDSSQVYGASYMESVGTTKITSERGFVHFMINYRPDFYKTTLVIPKDAIKDLVMVSGLPESTLSFVKKQADGNVVEVGKERNQEIRQGLNEFNSKVKALHNERVKVLREREISFYRQQSIILENTQIAMDKQETLIENARKLFLYEQDEINQNYSSMELDLTVNAYRNFREDEYFYFRISSKYGNSMFSAVRKDVKILNLVEQALALARLARSGVARIYYVNTAEANPQERRDIMQYIEEKFTQQQTFDAQNQLWKTEYYPFNYLDDIFLPVTGGKGDVKVEQIGGDIDIKAIVDIEWFLSKVFAGIKVPKAYLGFEEMMPGALGSTTLVRSDIRYARTIKKLQRAFLNGLKLLVKYHLECKYQKEISWEDIPLQLATISGAEESDRWEALKEKLEIANSIMSFVTENKGDVQLMARTLYDNFLDINYEGVTSKELFPDKKKGTVTSDEEAGGEFETAGEGQFAVGAAPSGDIEAVADESADDAVIDMGDEEGPEVAVGEVV